MKSLMLAGAVSIAVGTAYYAGTQRGAAEAAPAGLPPSLPQEEPRLQAVPFDGKINNPTAILLGEVPVPESALRGTIEPAEGLIVPDLKK